MQLKLLRFLFGLLGRIFPSLTARLAVAIFYSPRKFPAAQWEKAGIALGKEEVIHFDGENLTASVWANDGPTVLLVHGWQGRRSQLVKIAIDLSEKGYRVVMFDGPAHGSSQKKRTTLVEFSEAVECAAKHFGPLHAIVGHSFGAAASAIAMRRGVRVQCAVLISCPYSLRHVVSSFSKLIGLPSRSHEKMYPIMEKLHQCLEDELCFETLGPDLAHPLLLIHDTTDRYISVTDAEMVLRTIQGAKLVRTQGLGHMRILQDDGVIAHIAAFVTEPTQQRLGAA